MIGVLEIRLSKCVPDGSVSVEGCIYCGTKRKLTNEHSIPHALWGTWQIKHGSCELCAQKTSGVERFVTQNVLGRVREALKSPTRRKGKRTGKVSMGRDGEEEAMVVDIWSTPPFLVMPHFDFLPRSLTGDEANETHAKFNIRIAGLSNVQDPNLSGMHGPSIPAESERWARFLTKIAYCEYIRTVDTGFRSNSLSDFILNGSGDPSSFVGSAAQGKCRDCIYIVTFCALSGRAGGYHVVGYLRLFAFVETPSYIVHLTHVGDRSLLPAGLAVKQEWDRESCRPEYPEEEYKWPLLKT
jgi:hypothetical protein